MNKKVFLDKNGLPTKAGTYLIKNFDGSEENIIEVYDHPIKGLTCFKNNCCEISIKDSCYIPVQNTRFKFIRFLKYIEIL